MVVHKLVMGSADLYRSRLYCRSFVDSCNFTNKANSHAPKVEISTGEKLCHFGRYVGKAKLICLKSFVPSYSDWSVHMGKFPSRLPRSRSQKPISETGPARLVIRTHQHFYEEMGGEARSRRPSQPARLTGRAHMKRP